jgi:hypothetical protein
MKIAPRLFVAPVSNDNHGKSTIVKALVAHGLGKEIESQRKGVRELTSPWGTFAMIWRKQLDERWTMPNPRFAELGGQLEARGCDLWGWICRALAHDSGVGHTSRRNPVSLRHSSRRARVVARGRRR